MKGLSIFQVSRLFFIDTGESPWKGNDYEQENMQKNSSHAGGIDFYRGG